MKRIRTLLYSSAMPLALVLGGAANAQNLPEKSARAEAPGLERTSLGPAELAMRAGARDAAGRAVLPQDRAKLVVNTRLAEPAAGELVLVQEREGRGGRIHQRFEQRLDGKRIYGASVQASFDDKGAMMRLHERVARGRRAAPALTTLSPADALEIALREHFPSAPTPAVAGTDGNVTTFSEEAFFHIAPQVEAVYLPSSGGLAEGYLVKTWSDDTNELYHTLVGPDGKVVFVEDRTAEDQYGIFPDHPGNTSQIIAAGPGSGNAQSPAGWLFSGTQSTFRIRGNNVYAYLDTDNNNSPDSGGTSVTTGSFITAAALSSSPSITQNKEVAVQNLFYFNNVIHDELYRHGFVESAGNFQEDNFGKGGSGSDSVNAEAQDGGGTNNANFATPSDGFNPRMQMYLWSLTSPWRDGDLDSDIIWHEYGHGLTWRMIGSMSGSISGAIGEGMSDVLAIIINNDDRVGEYSTNDPNGIRSETYTNYTRTIGDFTGSSVHFDGEIYAATMWRLWQLWQADGRSRDSLMSLMVDGMNFTAPGPDYMDMRNGLLDAGDAAEDCLVWEAFAQFGMGVNSSMSTFSVTESFNLPSSCGGSGGGGGTFPEPGAYYSLQNVATGNYLDADGGGGIDQFTSAGRDDRHWRFDAQGDGTYWIVGQNSSVGALDSAPNNVVQWFSSSTPTGTDQKWVIEVLSDGSIRMDNQFTGRGYIASSGSSSVIWNTGQQDNASRWIPVKVN